MRSGRLAAPAGDLRGVRAPAECARPFLSGGDEPGARLFRFENGGQRRRDLLRFAGVEKQCGSLPDLAERRVVRAAARHPIVHRLDQRQAEPFEKGGEHIAGRIPEGGFEISGRQEAGEENPAAPGRVRRRGVDGLRPVPVRPRADEPAAGGQALRQEFEGADEVQVVFPGRLDARYVQDIRLRGEAVPFRPVVQRIRHLRQREAVPDHPDLLRRNAPERFEIPRRRTADRQHRRGAADEKRQHMLQIKHAEAVVFAGDMVLGEVVNHRNRKERPTGESAPVRGRDQAEIVLFPADPERQDQQVPEHRTDGAAGPAGRLNGPEAGEESGVSGFDQQRQVMPLRRQLADHVPDVG